MKKRNVLMLAALFASFAVNAMTLQVVGKQLFATGPIGGDDYLKFKAALDSPTIDTVVLVNSPGGDLWTGLTVGRLIAEKGHRTVAMGQCMSACSIIFMGGKQRRFGNALRPVFNVIGLHGAHDAHTKQVNPTLQPQIYAFYKSTMGEAFNANMINTALYVMEDSGGMLNIPETTRAPKAMVVHCKGRQTPRNQCTEYPGHNGLTLGVLTDQTLEDITLPEAFRQTPSVLGKPLNQAIDSLPQYLEELAGRQCVLPACKEQVKKWSALQEHKAIAARIHGPGLAWTDNASSPMRSFVDVIYRCNHARGLPVGLCRTELVDGYDVRGLYSLVESEHMAARQALQVPTQRFYGNEEFGGGFTRVNGYRTERLDDITPQSLSGIQTIGTQELAKSLLSEHAPVLLDVWGAANDVLPTAKTLLNGGLALADASAEQAYHQRFVALLDVLAPEKNKALVFYCAGRNCWSSVNAALRAKAAGYAQVGWYRGGYTAWKAAGLPTALMDLQAVVHLGR